MSFPNFIVIGAAKCGTTSICSYLNQHPQIFISPVKEPRFFAPEFYTTYNNGPIRNSANTLPMTLEEYKDLFKEVTSESAVGEASTEYLYFSESSDKISETIPDARLIAILRDPAERAFSAYCYQLRDGVEDLTFERALQDEERRYADNWRPGWLYKRVGFYYDQLLRYYKVFNRNQIRVVLYQDLDKRPLETVQNIFRYLEVDSTFTPDFSRENVSLVPKSKILNKLLSNQSIFFGLKHYFPEGMQKSVSSIKKSNYLPKPQLERYLRSKLVSIYKEDILKLQDLIDKDLSDWMLP